MNFERYESDAAVVADLANPTYETFLDNGVIFNHASKIEFADKFREFRSRRRGTFTTTSLDAFHFYINRNASDDETQIFIDPQKMQAVAILNYAPNFAEDYQMGHCDYKAVLNAHQLAIFTKILEVHNAGRMTQRQMAEFLEDYMHELTAYDSNHEVLDIKQAVAAVHTMTVNEHNSTDTRVGDFNESRSKFEKIEVTSRGNAMPAYFSVTSKCYHCLENEMTIKMRFGIVRGGDNLMFKLSIVSIETLSEQLSNAFSDVIANKMGDKYCVFIGEFTA